MSNNTSECNVMVDVIDKTTWEELIQEFDDATIYQTWSAGAINQGVQNLSHIMLKRNSEVVAMAQISIKKIPIIKAGIATVYWGPLWRRKGRDTDYSILDNTIVALKNEYIYKRGLLLRIWPSGFEISKDETRSALERHGFIRNTKVQPYRTLLLDILPSKEELRKNLAQKWRNQLNTAEKSNLSLTEGNSDEMFNVFIKMLQETVARKKFETRVNYNQYREIQNDLPDCLKMNIIICLREDVPVAAGVFSAIGSTGFYLLGATANKGLRVSGSNLIHWRVITWLKERGCKWYDLGGIDPVENPGVYNFKLGIAGKSGLDSVHVGQYYLADNLVSQFLSICIEPINYVKLQIRKGFEMLHGKRVLF